MALQCNLDARGKLVRLICGIVALIAGILLTLLWAMPSGAWVAWLMSIGVTLAGAFAIFEARTGWCVIRAMGFKMPF